MKSKFLADFKAFAMRGNVIDMAVGVIIGGAFGKIVSSLVNDIIMPLRGIVVGGVNFTDLKWVITPASVDEAGNEIAESTLNYGTFIQSTIDFLIIAFSIFVMVRVITKITTRKKVEEEAVPAPAPEPSNEEKLLAEIRDLLKEKK